MDHNAQILRSRIDRFRAELESARLADEVRSIASEVLRIIEQIVVTADLRWPTHMVDGPINTSANNTLDQLREVLKRANNVAVLDWVKHSAMATINWMAFPPENVNWSDLREIAEPLPSVAQRANLLLDSYSLEDERDRILEDVRRSAEVAASAAQKAQKSAGVSGSSSLATHFSTYARQERKAAESFRVLAIVGVLGALVAAIAFGPIEPGDWSHLTYRLAVVAAAGTLAAYFARQAGQHRRVYNWAKSLEVQMKSFPAFVEPIAEVERVEIYRAFARRVLSGPPEKGSEVSEDNVGAAQLLDLVTALAKKA